MENLTFRDIRDELSGGYGLTLEDALLLAENNLTFDNDDVNDKYHPDAPASITNGELLSLAGENFSYFQKQYPDSIEQDKNQPQDTLTEMGVALKEFLLKTTQAGLLVFRYSDGCLFQMLIEMVNEQMKNAFEEHGHEEIQRVALRSFNSQLESLSESLQEQLNAIEVGAPDSLFTEKV